MYKIKTTFNNEAYCMIFIVCFLNNVVGKPELNKKKTKNTARTYSWSLRINEKVLGRTSKEVRFCYVSFDVPSIRGVVKVSARTTGLSHHVTCWDVSIFLDETFFSIPFLNYNLNAIHVTRFMS